MSAQAGWYPDPGGVDHLYRYWDGRVWSAATSTNPSAPAPTSSLGAPPSGGSQPLGSAPLGSQPLGRPGGYPGAPAQGSYAGQGGYPGQGGIPAGQARPGVGAAPGGAYQAYQQTTRKRSGTAWWLAGAALLVAVVVVVVAVLALRSGPGGGTGPFGGGQASDNACPQQVEESPGTVPDAQDGRVHGGPISYPELGSPWSGPGTDDRVPFGSDVKVQEVLVESNYDGKGNSWVASVLVGRLQAGDGFFTPQQGSQIVVKCILGKFYGNAEVTSDVKKDQKAEIDGHDGWLVESHLTFDIKGLQTKGELLIVAIVKVSDTSSGLYYASIPDTTPELVQPARDALKELQVDS